ncbi:SIS domain-containing protein, partial [Streptococcus salivarius]|uniref:SIS domain-containing protein n=1 Tax=Streptococcus salivarius TaxID=1304 RepID=UPI001D07926B
QTEEVIDEDKLQRIATLIEDADRVYFFGIGSSGLVARDMKLRFMRLGVVCAALTDQDGFAWTTSILDKNCLV